MRIKLPAHLHRNRYGVLYFRIAIPRDLRPFFPTKEVYRSLCTASISKAIISVRKLTLAYTEAFAQLREEQSMSGKHSAREDDGIQTNWQVILKTTMSDGRTVELIARDEPHDTPETVEALARGLAAGLNPNASTPSHASRGRPLSELIDAFRAEKMESERWSSKTNEENQAIFRELIEIVGDQSVTDITREQAVNYLKTIKQLPANRHKRKEFQGLSVTKTIALKAAPMAVRSVNKRIERVSSLFKWAMQRPDWGLTHNPFEGLSLPEKNVIKRRAFTVDELTKLLSAEEFRSRVFTLPYTYWLIPLALFTGARLNELCQLHLSDFIVRKDVDCISISDEKEGQKLKTKNARRIVPLHSRLKTLGLLDYVQQLRAAGQERLFPELTKQRDGYGSAPSKWFKRLRGRVGIHDKHTKVFHSFRHTFITYLFNARVTESEIAPIVGHEGKLITGQIYFDSDENLASRHANVAKFCLPEEVDGLIPTFSEVLIKGGQPVSSNRAMDIPKPNHDFPAE